MTWLTGKLKAAVAAALIAGSLLGAPAPIAAAPDEAVLDDLPYANRPPVAEQTPDGAAAFYTVRPGDTLSGIAARFGGTVADLMRANRITDGDLIAAGRVLAVPGGVRRHRVAEGETLSAIARRYGAAVDELARVNGLGSADLLPVGRELIIPRGADRAVPAAADAGAFAGWDMLPGWNAVAALPLGRLPWPVAGRVSSPFGLRAGHPHEGVDIAADAGAPIRAIEDGRVIFAGPRGTYGNTVIIEHAGGLQTLYAHASRVLVRAGQEVRTGEVIALVGSTGRSTGPHLHLEVLRNGVHYDPLLCLQRMYA